MMRGAVLHVEAKGRRGAGAWVARASLALCFCLCLCCSLVPTRAWAEDEDVSVVSSDESPSVVELEGEPNVVDPTQRADNSFIYDTTIESLFEQASLYDERTVQVVGEVIGDIVVEHTVGSKYCWITLTSVDADNPSTISVLLSQEQASQIDHLGRYGVTGTILQVRGTYHQACSDHEGIPDIHATNSSVLSRGTEHPDLLDLNQFAPGMAAVLLGLVLMGVYYLVRERTR